jgi:Mg-chelatase subunit ChlD
MSEGVHNDGFDSDLEARLVALILGEASEFEVESLERLMAGRPEVAELKKSLEEINEVVVESARPEGLDDAEWKLSPKRREHVMATLGIGEENGNGGNGSQNSNGNGEQKEARIRRSGRKVIWAAAACLMINVVLFGWLITTKIADSATKGAEGETMMSSYEQSSLRQASMNAVEDEDEKERNLIAMAPSRENPAMLSSGRRIAVPQSHFAEVEPEENRAKRALANLRENLSERTEYFEMAFRAGGPTAQGAGEVMDGAEKRAPIVGGISALDDDSKVEPGEPVDGDHVVLAENAEVPAPAPVAMPLPALSPPRSSRVAKPGGGLGGGGGGGFLAQIGEDAQPGRAGRAKSLNRSDLNGRAMLRSSEQRDGLIAASNGKKMGAGQSVANRELLRGGNGIEEADRLSRPGERRASVLSLDLNGELAKQDLEKFGDPVRTSPALTVDGKSNGDKVRQRLDAAEGFKDLGLYDDAIREYQSSLRTDPTNAAARRGLEGIHQLKSDHYQASYDEGRARMLAQVDEAWEVAVPPEGAKPGNVPGPKLGFAWAGKEGKSKEVVIPEVNFESLTVAESPQPVVDENSLPSKTVAFGVTPLPRGSGEGEEVLTRKWKVSPTFLTDIREGIDAGAGESDPFGGDDTGLGSSALKPRRPLVDLLKESGINFPPGSSAQFDAATSTLMVSNTSENLALMDLVTQQAGASASRRAPVDQKRFNELFKRRSGQTDREREQERIADKLKNIILPVVDFENTTVEEAVDFLQQRARELDDYDLDPSTRGLRFQIRKPRLSGGVVDGEDSLAADAGSARVKELKLRNVPLGNVLQYVCAQARLRYKIDENGITLLPIGSGEGEDILTRMWEVHPDLMEDLRSGSVEWLNESGVFSDGEPMTEKERAEQREQLLDRPLVEIFREAGIDFPPGSAVQYNPSRKVLIVNNTPQNNDLVDQLFEAMALDAASEKISKESEEQDTKEAPYSTFSLHVSDVSFKLAKASLDKAEWPAAGELRVEDFVNAFDYGDPKPRMSEKVACRMEQAAHPFMQQRNMLRISMRTAAVGRAGGIPLAVTVLLDKSGSMERVDRAESVQRAFEYLAQEMGSGDVISVISFARTPRLLVDRVPGKEAGRVARLVALTPSAGGTNLEEALRAGLEKAREQMVEGGQNRIILLTDGAANLGNARPEDLAKLVEKMRESGIAFDACGVGAAGLNDEILESLTRKGDGRYYFLDRPEDADAGFAKQIAGALRPAAKNVKVQVHFNPKRVGRYKLYGFEEHELKSQDFRNDSVDAAEMAAEEAGNAIYQLEVLPAGEGEIGTVSVRFLDLERGQMVEQMWTIPYEGDAPRLMQSAPSMRLAASAALLGEKLNGSAIGERVRLDALVKLTGSLKVDYPSNERVHALIEMTANARELE